MHNSRRHRVFRCQMFPFLGYILIINDTHCRTKSPAIQLGHVRGSVTAVSFGRISGGRLQILVCCSMSIGGLSLELWSLCYPDIWGHTHSFKTTTRFCFLRTYNLNSCQTSVTVACEEVWEDWPVLMEAKLLAWHHFIPLPLEGVTAGIWGHWAES